MSGARDRRPALVELMADARRRRFRAVVVWSLDRFGRSLPQIVANVHELAARGIEFASIKQAIDLSSMQGRLTLYVFAMLAEIERDLIAQRVKAGLAATRAK
jgi:DNA invertase Pin-like site-specific DNA recombinase